MLSQGSRRDPKLEKQPDPEFFLSLLLVLPNLIPSLSSLPLHFRDQPKW